MKPWQIAILLKPLAAVAFAGSVAGVIWFVQRLPESRIKRLLLKRWD